MKTFKRAVTILLVVAAVLSLFSLSGCKKKDGSESPDTPPVGNVEDNTEVEDKTVLGYNDGEEPFEERTKPVGFLTSGENIQHYDVFVDGRQVVTVDEGKELVLIPIESVPAYTMIHVPITINDIDVNIITFYDYWGEVYVAYDLSRACAPVGMSNYSLILHNDVRRLVCHACGQVFDLAIMGVRRDLDLDTCRPWTIYHDEMFDISDCTPDMFSSSVYPWISSTETGDYDPWVPYVTPEAAASGKIIALEYESLWRGILEWYELFHEWE